MYDKLFSLLSAICHQNPQRSFFWGDVQFILCARCTGIYLGVLFTLILCPLVKVNVSLSFLYLILFCVLIINMITFITMFDTNIVRLLTGSAIGILSGFVIIKSIKNILSKENQNEVKKF